MKGHSVRCQFLEWCLGRLGCLKDGAGEALVSRPKVHSLDGLCLQQFRRCMDYRKSDHLFAVWIPCYNNKILYLFNVSDFLNTFVRLFH